MFLDFSRVNTGISNILSNKFLRSFARYARLGVSSAHDALTAVPKAVSDYNSVLQGYVEEGVYHDITPTALKNVAASNLLAVADNVTANTEIMRGLIASNPGRLPASFNLSSVGVNANIRFVGYGFVITENANYFNPKLFALSCIGLGTHLIHTSENKMFRAHAATVDLGVKQGSSFIYPIGAIPLGDRFLRSYFGETGTSIADYIRFSSGSPVWNGTGFDVPMKKKQVKLQLSFGNDAIEHVYYEINGIQYDATEHDEWIELVTTAEETLTYITSGLSNFYLLGSVGAAVWPADRCSGLNSVDSVDAGDILRSMADPSVFDQLADDIREAAQLS